jgi:RHS repeat-associated protein
MDWRIKSAAEKVTSVLKRVRGRSAAVRAVRSLLSAAVAVALVLELGMPWGLAAEIKAESLVRTERLEAWSAVKEDLSYGTSVVSAGNVSKDSATVRVSGNISAAESNANKGSVDKGVTGGSGNVKGGNGKENSGIEIGGAVGEGSGAEKVRPGDVFGAEKDTRGSQELIVKYKDAASAEESSGTSVKEKQVSSGRGNNGVNNGSANKIQGDKGNGIFSADGAGNVKKAALEEYSYNVKEELDGELRETLSFDSGEAAMAAAEELYEDDNVEYVQLNYPLTVMSDEEWGIENNGQEIEGIAGAAGIDINVAEIFGVSRSEIVVAVIDTGIDAEHPALLGKVLDGWDFADNDGDTSPEDGEEHGTHLAGIVERVASNAKILPVRFASVGGGYTSDAIKAIEYAEEVGAEVVLCAWGGYAYNPALYDAMQGSDMVFVCAAGNSGTAQAAYPAAFDLPNVISVGGHNNTGALTRSSAFGIGSVDFAAPGKDVYSALPGGGYGYRSGTSQAAAFTTGAAAFLRGSGTELSANDTAFVLTYTARPADELAGMTLTGGMLDLGAAYEYLVSGEDTSAREILPVYYDPLADEEISALLSAHNNFGSMSGEEQTLLCDKLGMPVYAMQELSEAGYSIDASIEPAGLIGITGFGVSELEQIRARLTDDGEYYGELYMLSSFLREEGLAGEEAAEIRAQMLLGRSLQNIMFAYPASAALGIPIGALTVGTDADVTGINGSYSGVTQADKAKLLALAQELYVRAEALTAYAEATGLSGDDIRGEVSLWLSLRSIAPENSLFSEDETGVEAPFVLDSGRENIQLNTGAVSYSVPGVTLPGRNGLDLNIGLTYNSGQAVQYDVTLDYGTTMEVVGNEYCVKTTIMVTTGAAVGVNPATGQAVAGQTGYVVTSELGPYTTLAEANAAKASWLAAHPNNSPNTAMYIATVQTVDIKAPVEHISHFRSQAENEAASGWDFGFPYISVKPFGMSIHLGDGSEYSFSLSSSTSASTNLISSSSQRKDITFHKDSGTVSVFSVTSAYVLKYKDGSKVYFAADGRLLKMTDRYGNEIKWKYKVSSGNININGYGTGSVKKLTLEQIIDSAGRTITFDYNTTAAGKDIVVNLPDGQNITYRLEPVDGNRLEVTKFIDQAGRETEFEYTVESMPLTISTQGGITAAQTKAQRLSVILRILGYDFGILGINANNITTLANKVKTDSAEQTFLLLSEVTYPTGAGTVYEYEIDNYVPSNAGYIGISRLYARAVSRYDTTNGQDEYNIKTFTYTGSYLNDSSGSSYTYSTTATDADGVSTEYTFNSKHLLTNSKVRGTDGSLLSEEITAYSGRLPTSVTMRSYSGAEYTERKDTYTYNTQGDMLTHDRQAIDNANIEVGVNLEAAVTTTMATIQNGSTYITGVLVTAQTGVNPSTGQSVTGASVRTANGTIYSGFLVATTTTTTYAVPDTHTTTYTYDSTYHFPLTKTYKKDADTTVKEEYVKSTDGKGIRWLRVYENNALKSQTEFVYDTYGNVTETRAYKDGFGSYISAFSEYSNSNPELTSAYNGVYMTRSYVNGVKDADGALTGGSGHTEQSFVYDAYGRPLSVTDGNGNTTETEYDALGRIVSVTNPDGTQKTQIYDDTANEVTITDERGTELVYKFDGLGRIREVWDPVDEAALSGVIYDAKSRVSIERTVVTPSLMTAIRYDYDDLGRIVGKYRNEITNWNYSVGSNTGGSTDGSTFATGYIPFDPPTVSMSLSPYESYEYDSAYEMWGELYQRTEKTVYGGSVTAPDITTVEYRDAGGYLIYSGAEIGGEEYLDSYAYDYIGNTVSVLTAQDAQEGRGYSTQYAYDVFGHVTSETNALGQTVNSGYDALGRNVWVSDYAGNTTEFEYDELGRLLIQRTPAEEIDGEVYYAETRYDYDNNGNITKQMVKNNAPDEDEHFAVTEYEYNARGFLTGTVSYPDSVSPVPYTVSYSYDAGGNMTAQNAGGAVTHYSYDRFGNVTETEDALGQSEYYTYDYTGNVVTKTDRNGTVTENTYDGLGRLTESNAGGEVISYTYALTGAVLTESNGDVWIEYAYDELGRVASVVETGDTEKYYAYDLSGNRTGFVMAHNGELIQDTEYEYDALGRLTEVWEGGELTAEYTYDANGNRESLEYGNGTAEYYEYNLANWVVVVENEGADGETLSRYEYEYFLDGNQRTKTDHNGNETSYAYDDIGRLTEESREEQSVYYVYDNRSNRIRMVVTGEDAGVTEYFYDGNNRLTDEERSIDGELDSMTVYEYDSNGNMIHRDVAGSEWDWMVGVYDPYYYNARNQLTSAEIAGESVSYTYRPDGLRQTKNDTLHLWDGSNIVADIDNGEVTCYIRGVNLLAYEHDGELYYYSHNAHGDTVALTDEYGNIVKTYDYDAFGVETDIDEDDANPFRYCGEYYDKETKTYYLRARYYSPATGRFINEDTYAGERDDPLSLNLYTYCVNNPVMFRDPTGHSAEDVLMGLATALGDDVVNGMLLALAAGAIDLSGLLGIASSVSDMSHYYIGRVLGHGIAILLSAGMIQEGLSVMAAGIAAGVGITVGSGGTLVIGGLAIGAAGVIIGGVMIVASSGIAVAAFEGLFDDFGKLTDELEKASGGNGGSENNDNLSLKKIKNNNRANEVAKDNGFDGAEDLKRAYVKKGNESKFDMYRNTKTGEIWLKAKQGKALIPTGLYD